MPSSRLALIGILLFASVGSAQTAEEAEPPVVKAPIVEKRAIVVKKKPILKARPVEPKLGHRAVKSLEVLRLDGGRLDAARRGNLIAFDQGGQDDRRDVYTLDVNNGRESCVTCELYDFRKLSVFNPTWHPSGEFLIVQVTTSSRRRQVDLRQLAGPFRGLGSELWMLPIDGRGSYRITNTGERGGVVLDPHFSYEGDLLVWSERVTNRRPPWGEWSLRVAKLKGKKTPRPGKIRSYQPIQGLLLAEGFTPDDGGLIVATTERGGLTEYGLDLMRLDLETEEMQPITRSPDVREGLASPVPSSHWTIVVSDRDLARQGALPWRGDLRLSSSGGRLEERLTYFNADSDHGLGEVMIDDLAWLPDGRLLLHVVSTQPAPGQRQTSKTQPPVYESIWILELDRDQL